MILYCSKINCYFKRLFQQPVPTVDVALYNITADPYEKNDLSQRFPDIVKKLQDRVQFYMKGAVPPANKPSDPEARNEAKKNGAWTPWMWNTLIDTSRD